jgi:hypothetical protein
MVNFPVYALAELPAGMYYSGATGGSGSVVLTYKSADQKDSFGDLEEPFTGNPNLLSWVVGADAEIPRYSDRRSERGLCERFL